MSRYRKKLDNSFLEMVRAEELAKKTRIEIPSRVEMLQMMVRKAPESNFYEMAFFESLAGELATKKSRTIYEVVNIVSDAKKTFIRTFHVELQRNMPEEFKVAWVLEYIIGRRPKKQEIADDYAEAFAETLEL